MRLHGITEGHVLAMCHRGLVLTTRTRDDGSLDTFLSCRFHSDTRFPGLWQAMTHFENFGVHNAEEEEHKLIACEYWEKNEPHITEDSKGPAWVLHCLRFMRQLGWNLAEDQEMQGPNDFIMPERGYLEALEFAAEHTWMLHGCPEGASQGPDAPIRFEEREVLQSTLPKFTYTDVNDIDATAFALLYMQWLAYGQCNKHVLLEQWPSRVRHLAVHCTQFVADLCDLNAAIAAILQYTPREWHSQDGGYIPQLRQNMAAVWKSIFKIRGFISEGLSVQLKWYFALNYYAVQYSLSCKFLLKGVTTQTPELAFQAQGRCKSTRYKHVSNKRRRQDISMGYSPAAPATASHAEGHGK